MPVNPRSILNLLQDRLQDFTTISGATQAEVKLVDLNEDLLRSAALSPEDVSTEEITLEYEDEDETMEITVDQIHEMAEDELEQREEEASSQLPSSGSTYDPDNSPKKTRRENVEFS
ncbi:hypothetical protein RvY_16779 [Ramazzottius varieornatus]|uniref:Uncharacterized protein n=1 Tax=Ramazzottius varieornatus TaxID=947166 RepID=A0A1D1W5Z4_RAMVA|nr:hypothetical protein RvY_16779 [Ramazzottius varieornatus]